MGCPHSRDLWVNFVDSLQARHSLATACGQVFLKQPCLETASCAVMDTHSSCQREQLGVNIYQHTPPQLSLSHTEIQYTQLTRAEMTFPRADRERLIFVAS